MRRPALQSKSVTPLTRLPILRLDFYHSSGVSSQAVTGGTLQRLHSKVCVSMPAESALIVAEQCLKYKNPLRLDYPHDEFYGQSPDYEWFCFQRGYFCL